MQKNRSRIYFMDSMRATLMMLGVVVHAAQVFNPQKSWNIYSSHSTAIAEFLVSFIHAFRMPVFFVISGYFCAVTLRSYGVRRFVQIRLRRIVVPFFFTALLLNSIQTFLLSRSGWYAFDVKTYLLTGGYISHLWFLINLMVYFSVAALCAIFFRNAATTASQLLDSIYRRLGIISVLSLLPLFSMAILLLNKVGLPLYVTELGIFNIYLILSFAPYFVFGMSLSVSDAGVNQLCKINPYWVGTLILVIALIERTGYFSVGVASHSAAQKLVWIYLSSLIAYYSVAMCFYLFNRFLNYSSEKVQFFSEASYTVYLFHHVLVIAIGLVLIRADINGLIGMLALIAAVMSVSLLIHKYVVAKYKFALFLFNGK